MARYLTKLRQLLCHLLAHARHVDRVNKLHVIYLGHILRGKQRQERGQGLLRDQQGNRRDLHESNVRSREAGCLRPGGGGPRWSTFRTT